MDANTVVTIITVIVVGILLITIGMFGFIVAFFLSEITKSYLYKKRSQRFNPLLLKLLEQQSPTKDVIDVFKTIFDFPNENNPDFASKIIVSLEDFKTWLLETEVSQPSKPSSTIPSQEIRARIN